MRVPWDVSPEPVEICDHNTGKIGRLQLAYMPLLHLKCATMPIIHNDATPSSNVQRELVRAGG